MKNKSKLKKIRESKQSGQPAMPAEWLYINEKELAGTQLILHPAFSCGNGCIFVPNKCYANIAAHIYGRLVDRDAYFSDFYRWNNRQYSIGGLYLAG